MLTFMHAHTHLCLHCIALHRIIGSAFEGSGALSMPAMLGSAIIAFGLVPPLCVLSTRYTCCVM
jgi:hypothetical protein